jgi:hypothetical protein
MNKQRACVYRWSSAGIYCVWVRACLCERVATLYEWYFTITAIVVVKSSAVVQWWVETLFILYMTAMQLSTHTHSLTTLAIRGHVSRSKRRHSNHAIHTTHTHTHTVLYNSLSVHVWGLGLNWTGSADGTRLATHSLTHSSLTHHNWKFIFPLTRARACICRSSSTTSLCPLSRASCSAVRPEWSFE